MLKWYMRWVEKAQPTPFDSQPIPGLYFLDGDQIARATGYEWAKGQKYPVILFPSGVSCDLWESHNPAAIAIVHLFGEMDLPLADTRDRAYEQAQDIARVCGYEAQKVGDNGLQVKGREPDEHRLIIYHETTGLMTDMLKVQEEAWTPPVHPAHQLMTDEIRALLPELYSSEDKGMQAEAVVKYFTPDANWTWYATEFDGDDTFFGLVFGDVVELGYFSLSELQEVRGGLGLPIERDLYFKPTTLAKLPKWHEDNR